MNIRKPSAHQKEIFNFIQRELGNLIVNATAGSGKTTTILECLKLIPINKSILFVSFSNTIVNELKERSPKHVKVSTLHSLGFSILRNKNKNLKLNNNKYFGIVLEQVNKLEQLKHKDDRKPIKEVYIQVYQILEIIQAIKLTYSYQKTETIREMGQFYGLEVTNENIDISLYVLTKTRNLDDTIDFADMLYKSLTTERLVYPKYDYIFYDEVQDSNTAQLKLIEKLLKPTSRLITVGDWNQAIYGFSFANQQSLEYLKNRKNTKILPLSVSYRCAKNIVLEAQKVNSEILPHPDKEDGVVRRGYFEEIDKGDMIVCRNTKPLIITYIKLLEDKKYAYVVGSDYGNKIVKYFDTFTLRGAIRDVEIVEGKIVKHLVKVKSSLLEIGIKDPTKHQKFQDEKEICSVLSILLKTWGVKDLINRVEDMFRVDTNKDIIKLMTIHRSKGLENNRVFFIDKFNKIRLIPSKFADQEWELQQERNIEFVGITRAKSELVYIEITD